MTFCGVAEDRVAGAIFAHAEQRWFDLIAMATHRRSGLGRLIMESIAAKVVCDTLKRVLLVCALLMLQRQVDWRPEMPVAPR